MAGLALANAVQNSCHAVVLYVLFARARPALRSPELLEFAGRLVVAGVICAAVVGVTGTAWSSWLAEPSLPHRLIALMLVAMAGVGSYGLALIGLRVSELEDLRSLLHRGGKR
jgi:peptidoglycan biosynthesis protein MviN/MurJ (putative lipid II flippase)